MKEHPAEGQLALYAGNDLLRDEAELVKQHLAECAACESVTKELREAGEWLASCESEPLGRDLRNVREHVMCRVSRRAGLRWWQWAPVPLACAAAAVLYWPAGERPVSKLVEHAVNRPKPVAVADPERPKPLLARAKITGPKKSANRSPGLRTVALLTPPGRAALIRLTTADPNVIILLEADERKNIDE